jgi:hypothetical protein
VEKLVLTPEYGGDGGKTIGVCASKIPPAAVFPALWAPNAMVRYDQKQFPARYRNGVFTAFHGSWNRAPYAQGGYNVVFQPLDGDRASGRCEIFAAEPPEGTHPDAGAAAAGNLPVPEGATRNSRPIRSRRSQRMCGA